MYLKEKGHKQSMVTIAQLNKKIEREKVKIASAEKKKGLEIKKSILERRLKVLQRSPSTQRNIKLAQRTSRGFKKLSKIAGKKLLKQGKLIRDQQLRDDARELKRENILKGISKGGGERVIITKTVTGKGKKKKTKTSRKVIKSKKTKKGKSQDFGSKIESEVFGNLDF